MNILNNQEKIIDLGIDWIIAISTLIGSILIGKIVKKYLSKKIKILNKNPESEKINVLLDSIKKYISLVFFFIGVFCFKSIITFPEYIQKQIDNMFLVGVCFFLARIIEKIAVNLFEYSTKGIIEENNSLTGMIIFLRKVIAVSIWVTIGLFLASNYGVNISSIIAGLGLGGLAFALAAQDTLSHFFASLAIFLDRPFKIGDAITINGVSGNVEEIGMRSTRIKTFDGTEVIIPNSDMASSKIENISKRKGIRFDFTLGLVYETPVEKVETALKIVKEILENNSEVEKDFWVHFRSFGDFSLNIVVKMVVTLQNGEGITKAFETKENINLKIMKAFEKEGLNFAFPSQTLYLQKSDVSQSITI